MVFKMLKKWLIVAMTAFTAISLLFMPGCQSTEKPPNSDTLTLGLQCEYPPFVFIDEKGTITGFDIDVAKQIAAKLGKKLVIKEMDFDGEILALQQGKIDIVMSGMNITPTREKEIFMAPYHGDTSTSLSLIFWNDIPPAVKSLEDVKKLSNSTISVGTGTIPESYMSLRFPAVPIRSFQGAFAGLIDVKYGKSVANLVETDVAKYLKKKHPEVEILEVALAKEDQVGGFGIGFSKNNPELFENVKQAIEQMKSSGELKNIEDAWFYAPPAD
jgi:arginine transport system substrate-binding protein